MYIACRSCSTRLSNDLQPIGFGERNETIGEEFLQRSGLMQEDGTFFHRCCGNYIAHPDDILRVKLTDDTRRLNGCCGLDGLDGPNLRCENCAAYVAVKITDCWTPHCVIFEPEAILTET